MILKFVKILLISQLVLGNWMNVHAAPPIMPDQTTGVSQTDEFNTSLEPYWSWIRESPSYWSVTDHPGYLRIITEDKDIWKERASAPLLLQPAPAGDFTIETKILFSPSMNFQQGGLLIYVNDDNYIRLTYGYFDVKAFQLGKEINGFFNSTQVGAPSGNEFFLKLEKIGSTVTGYYSPDGIQWGGVGQYVVEGFLPVSIGISAFNGNRVSEIPADFDYFTVGPVFTLQQLKRSEFWTGDETGLSDTNGRSWSDADFDDSNWTSVNLPDDGQSLSEPSNQYYRVHFTWDGKSPLSLDIASEDGLQISINGHFWNSWGIGWRQTGCLNNPLNRCSQSISIPSQVIPNEYLQTGDNVMAIDLWNSGISGTYYLNLTPHDVNLYSMIFLPVVTR